MGGIKSYVDGKSKVPKPLRYNYILRYELDVAFHNFIIIILTFFSLL